MHSLITHNDYLNNNSDWNLNDYLNLNKIMQDLHKNEEKPEDDFLEQLICDLVYSYKTNNKPDRNHVRKLVKQIILDKQYDQDELIENSHKFYSKSVKSNEAKYLLDEIKILFEIQKEKNPKLIENNISLTNNKDKLSLNFSSEFIKLLSEMLIDLEKTCENINNLTSSIMLNKFNLIHFMVFITDLNDYKNLFQNLYKLTADLIENAKGSAENLMSQRLFNFYLFINEYQSNEFRLNFFQALKIQIKNSIDLCDKLSKEYQENKQNDYALNRINLDVFYNPTRIVKKVLFDLNHQFLKKKLGFIESTNGTKISPSITPDLGIKLQERYFILDVLDSNQTHLSSTSDNCIILENIYLNNAYYDIMTNSFKPTQNKSVYRLDYVRINPVDQLTDFELSGVHKHLPFVNLQTKEEVCYFKVKFLHTTSSSLSNTKNSRTNHLDNANNENKNNLPVIYPIYFSIYNFNQDIISKMENLLN
jgi:hypothetical protein